MYMLLCVEEGPSFRVKTSCCKQLLEEELLLKGRLSLFYFWLMQSVVEKTSAWLSEIDWIQRRSEQQQRHDQLPPARFFSLSAPTKMEVSLRWNKDMLRALAGVVLDSIRGDAPPLDPPLTLCLWKNWRLFPGATTFHKRLAAARPAPRLCTARTSQWITVTASSTSNIKKKHW